MWFLLIPSKTHASTFHVLWSINFYYCMDTKEKCLNIAYITYYTTPSNPPWCLHIYLLWNPLVYKWNSFNISYNTPVKASLNHIDTIQQNISQTLGKLCLGGWHNYIIKWCLFFCSAYRYVSWRIMVYCTLPETKPLKINGWKMKCSFVDGAM